MDQQLLVKLGLSESHSLLAMGSCGKIKLVLICFSLTLWLRVQFMNVTNTSVTISRLQYMHPFAGNLPCITIHLKDANADDIQFFIDKLPASVKGETG